MGRPRLEAYDRILLDIEAMKPNEAMVITQNMIASTLRSRMSRAGMIGEFKVVQAHSAIFVLRFA